MLKAKFGKKTLIYLVSGTTIQLYKIPSPQKQLFLFIIQQIVTLSKYGHDALNICHP